MKTLCNVCSGEKPCGEIIISILDEDGFDYDDYTYEIYIKNLKAKFCPECGRKIE